MTGLPVAGQFAGRLGVVNCVHQTKQLDVRWQRTRVHPPFIRIYQIRRSRYYNDFPPNCRRHKNKKLSRVPATNLIAHRQSADHVAYPAKPANDNGSLSMANALENQPHDPDDERDPPFTGSPLKTEKSPPPRPQCGMHWTRQY
jgi:hypothetical protein